MRRTFRLLLAVALVVFSIGSGLVPASFAQSVPTSGVGVGSFTHYTGFAWHVGGTIEDMPVSASVQLTSNTIVVSMTVRAGFTLIDGGNMAVGAETFSAAETHFVSPGLPQFFTQTALFTPGGIQEGASYRLVTQLYRQRTGAPGGWDPLGAARTSLPYRFTFAMAGQDAGTTGWLRDVALSRDFVVSTLPELQSFPVSVSGVLGRCVEPAAPVTTEPVTFELALVLAGSVSGQIPLQQARVSLMRSLANHSATSGPVGVAFSETIAVTPAVPLDPTESYSLAVTPVLTERDGSEHATVPAVLFAQRLMSFNGVVRFGPVELQLRSLNGTGGFQGPAIGGGELTTLYLASDALEIAGAPGYTASAPAGLSVALRPDGTADPLETLAWNAAPGAEKGSVNGVPFTRGSVTLDASGEFVSTPLTIRFPAGFSYAEKVETRRHKTSWTIPSVHLDANLLPVGQPVMRPAQMGFAEIFVAHERLPLLFKTRRITWDVTTATFAIASEDATYVRKTEMELLVREGVRQQLEASGLGKRPSNELYYSKAVLGSAPTVLIQADADGRALLAAAELLVEPGRFDTHFPYKAQVRWRDPGLIRWTANTLDTANSVLPSPTPFQFGHVTDCGLLCAGGAPLAPESTFEFTPTQDWAFTADGGLRVPGQVPALPLRWGARSATQFAHETEPFFEGSFLVAGHVLTATATTTTADHGPGALLLAGHGTPTDSLAVERPATPAYSVGDADYPGVNFRVTAAAPKVATSLIGDKSLGPYDLDSRSKYYLRKAGLSGIHEAVTASFTALLGGLEIYEFPMTLSGLQLSYLDNTNRESLIAGSVTVPGVHATAPFTQDFTRLALRCNGQIGALTLRNPNTAEHALDYWRVRFRADRAEFVYLGDACAPKKPALLFAASVQLPKLVKETLTGGLGFKPDGNLATYADGYEGVDSKLRRPARVSLQGYGAANDPSRAGFTVTPATDFAFNNAFVSGAPDEGFISFAGLVDVPFFEDLRVHVLARATGGKTFVRGGWDDNDGTGHTFFNFPAFDPNNRGFPVAKSYAEYLTNTDYDPIARKNWHGFVNFAFPVEWDSIGRKFSGARSQETDFLVLRCEQILKQLTPSGADLRFSANLLQLPRVNLSSLLIDGEEGVNAIVQHLPNGNQLVDAIKALEQLLSGQSDQLIDQAIDTQVDTFLSLHVDPALAAMQSAEEANLFFTGAQPILAQSLQEQLSGLAGQPTDTGTILHEVDLVLSRLDTGLGAADLLLRKGSNPAFTLLPDEPRAQFLGSVSAIAGSDGAGFNFGDTINGPLKGTLDEIHTRVVDLHGAVGSTRSVLNSLQAALQATLDSANSPGGLASVSVERMREYFAAAIPADKTKNFLLEQAPDPAASQAAVRAELRRRVRDAVHESAFVRDLRTTLKDVLEPMRDEYRETFERVNGVINDVVRTAITEALGETNNPLKDEADINRAIGAFRETLQIAKVDGTAQIDGDTLTAAHINASLGLHFPDAVQISGWLDYRHYKSGQPDHLGVSTPADGRIEIAVHAEGKAEIADNPAIQATLEGRYAMSASGAPRSVGGLFDFTSELNFDHMTLRNVRLEFAFGDRDNYVFGRGQGSFWFIDCDLRTFMGRTSDPALLARVDPDLGPLLTAAKITSLDATHPVSGIYWNGDGEGSLNRFFGIPDTPFLQIKGRGGEGTFAFTNDALFDADTKQWKFSIGKRVRRGIDVKLALAGASAELVVLAALDPVSLLNQDVPGGFIENAGAINGTITGRFTPKFSFGIKPFEVSVKKDFRITMQGAYTPPPFAPPPGFFVATKLNFD